MQPQNSAFTMLFVAWGIAYVTRRRPIGGWLLYFYLQLCVSFLISLFFIPQIISNINPNGWDSAGRYSMFVASTVPIIAAQWIEVYAATRLVVTKNAKNLWTLRVALYVLIAAAAVAIYIDTQYFDSNAVFDIMNCAFAVIWSEYFRRAVRVKQVFVDHTFSHPDVSPKFPKSRAETVYVWKRAIIIATTTSVIMFFVIMSSNADKKPDVGMINMALIEGVIAGAVSLMFPIRKSKRESLQRLGRSA